MQREINPHLFGTEEKGEAPSSDLEFPGNDQNSAINLTLIRGLERQVLELRNQVKMLEAKLAEAQNQIAEISKVQTLRLDRAAQAMPKIEQYQFKSVQDLSEKYAVLSGKINERRVAENKIEELIDRHNQLVQNFDLRLKQLHKVQADKDLQFLKSVAVLEEARAEIARLKKVELPR